MNCKLIAVKQFIYRFNESLTGSVSMATLKLSPKYQVVIPAEIRKKLKLRAGQEMAVIEKDGIIRIIPMRPLKEVKGFLKGRGITTEGLREETERT